MNALIQGVDSNLRQKDAALWNPVVRRFAPQIAQIFQTAGSKLSGN